jgi:biopolymer transport protein ExbB/TolQ
MFPPEQNNRQELDINIVQAIVIALLFTGIIFLSALPFADTYIGNLLLKRGFTQYLTIFSAVLVATITVNKYLKIREEKKLFKRLGIPKNVDFSDHRSMQLLDLQQDFARISNMITNRLARIFGAYIESGSRKTVTEFALDDSSFYLSSSESSYALPRILVWAIPLWGFIGTVIGISTAVNGFTGFLEQTAEIDQIKEGIGSVTSGLAVAFDTTLLALFLSVVVMIPLVLVEKMETQLLLATDIYINDQILPRLKEKETDPSLFNSQEIVKTITDTIETTLPKKEELIEPIKTALPSSEELISPAQIYAKKAAQVLVKEFIHEFKQIHQQEEALISNLQEITQVILTDRQNFLASFGQQSDINQSVMDSAREIVALVKENNQTNQDNLQKSSQAIVEQLNKAANSLEAKVISLEESSRNIAQVLNSVDKMHLDLSEIKTKISLLEPTLQQLSKPRVIKLIEDSEK